MRGLSTVLPLLALAGCEVVGGGGGASGSSDTPTSPPTTPWVTSTAGSWSTGAHPCVGNRTDAMWWDDRETVWVGCGSTTVGYGLFRSTDAGGTWSEVAPARLGAFRVSSIQRADDGWLYVAGIDTVSSDRVVRLDGSDAVEVVWQSGTQVWNSFHVGTFRRSPDGVSVAESLTGTGLVYRTADGAPFVDGDGWWPDTESFQILDLAVTSDGFFGAGSTIAQPPHVFLPDGTDPFTLTPVQLASFDGELWGIDADAAGIVAGGVDQDADVGVIFASGSDPGDPDRWRAARVDAVIGDDRPTWVRGACRAGPLLAAVGEFSMISDPLLLVSADDGASWNDWTAALPAGAGALHRCRMWADGRLAVAGQDGYVATWNPVEAP